MDIELPVVVPAQALKGGEVVSELLEIVKGLHLGGKSSCGQQYCYLV